MTGPRARERGRMVRFLPAVRAPFGRRVRAETAYVLLDVPLALGGALFAVVSTGLGLALSLTFVGLPLLALAGRGARALGVVRRWLGAALLGERVPPPARFRSTGRGFLGWLQSALRDPDSWRARAYLVLKLPLTAVSCYLTLVGWLLGLFWLTYPLWWQISGPGVARNGFLDAASYVFHGATPSAATVPHEALVHVRTLWYADSWPAALAVALAGAVLLLATPWVVHGLTWADRWLIRQLLAEPTSRRRVRELAAARSQVVADASGRLRRIERDLHDGAQAQLAAVAMTLGQAKEKLEHRDGVPFDPGGALDLVMAAHQQSKDALVELRDLVRGIHPPVLDAGLPTALRTLVGRSRLPVRLHIDLPERPSPPIEAIAYFSAAELLTNAGRHSRAQRVEVSVAAAGDRLRLRVEDDGVGGARTADPAEAAAAGREGGTGLAGLRERVRAVDGDLRVSSPPGGPTVVTVDLPWQP